MQKNPTFDIYLDRLAYGGDAMGRLPGGRAVFVPFGLPGERVRVRIVEEKKNFARAELLEVLAASPQRIPPKCKHFEVCGGCHYQNLSYTDQLSAKTAILRDQLQRIGKIENPPVQPMVACPNPWEYRNHVQFHLDRAGRLGFVNAAGNAVFPVDECCLPEASIDALWPQLEFEPGAPIARVSLRAGADGDLMLILEADEIEAPELELEAGISVVHLATDDALVMAGQDHLYIQVLGRDFRVSAASFFQVNTLMAGKMVEHLLERLPISPSTTVLDVYCGVGLFSAFLAGKCKRLVGIEVSPSACEDFTANLDEFENVELYEGTAEDVLPGFVGRIGREASRRGNSPHEPAIVLLDPPRAGLEKAALDGLLRLQPERIAYVSCDPSTLARDAARLVTGGYRLADVTPFDLFPQTYHIEAVSLFERSKK
ncbi:MAG: class I SAM-dependent RNA methyltransferase [Chloroflexota bacterium]